MKKKYRIKHCQHFENNVPIIEYWIVQWSYLGLFWRTHKEVVGELYYAWEQDVHYNSLEEAEKYVKKQQSWQGPKYHKVCRVVSRH